MGAQRRTYPALTFGHWWLEYCDGLGNDVRCFGPEVFERAQRKNACTTRILLTHPRMTYPLSPTPNDRFITFDGCYPQFVWR
ncbi:hypothetical protein RBSWK_04677 [Rhodopirellula baltica SWK14]|uniref:Uncharacterized protein n=1 Tax=Rhodopirellula baltica SWK14 TaxID=993516 RepID=L7CAX6_RHOBT|nr:hypothetical protein RBSWK_04677 [Rhodopirellula baltica SWK14]